MHFRDGAQFWFERECPLKHLHHKRCSRFVGKGKTCATS
jgi:hypothetical protein